MSELNRSLRESDSFVPSNTEHPSTLNLDAMAGALPPMTRTARGKLLVAAINSANNVSFETNLLNENDHSKVSNSNAQIS